MFSAGKFAFDAAVQAAVREQQIQGITDGYLVGIGDDAGPPASRAKA